jgi:sec-independent protein translocase protein TatA
MGSGLLSPTHLAVVLAIALIVFGPKRLPELGRAIGHGMRGFKDALDGRDDEPEVLAPPAAETPAAPVELADPAPAGAQAPPPAAAHPADAPASVAPQPGAADSQRG